MERIKTFLMYAIMVVVCYFGSNTLIYAGINTIYEDIANYQLVDNNKIQITINEAKATSINGYIKGIVKNNSNSNINEQYLRIDLFSKRNVNLGTKYIRIENLKANQEKEFELNFKLSNVSYYVITETNKI